MKFLVGVDDLLPSTGVLRWNRSPKKDTAESKREGKGRRERKSGGKERERERRRGKERKTKKCPTIKTRVY